MNNTVVIEGQIEANKGTVTLDSNWRKALAAYNQPSMWRSIWQLTNTIVPFGITLFLMYWTLGFNFWLTLALSPLAAGLLARTFIFFHDCGHGAFFKSRKLNGLVGTICGMILSYPV